MLDVGCGNGNYVGRAPGFAVGVDVDRSPQWLRDDRPYVVADAAALPFRDGAFGTVVSFETIEHTQDPVDVLKELRRVARDNGIFTVPNCIVTPGQRRSNLIFHHWIDETHRHFFNDSSLTSVLRSAGWVPRRISTINTIDLGPLVVEALRLPSGLERALSALLRRVGRRYDMTLLAVADARR